MRPKNRVLIKILGSKTIHQREETLIKVIKQVYIKILYIYLIVFMHYCETLSI